METLFTFLVYEFADCTENISAKIQSAIILVRLVAPGSLIKMSTAELLVHYFESEIHY